MSTERPRKVSNKQLRRWSPRLLSGKEQLTRVEAEAMFEHVMQHAEIASAKANTGRRQLFFRVTGAMASVACAAVLIVSVVGRQPRTPGQFEARGGDFSAPSLELRCVRGGPTKPCQVGDKLLMEIDAPEELSFVAAFAQRSDGVVIWYFPATRDGHSLDISSEARINVPQTAALIDAQHTPGHYVLYAVFSQEVLRRAQIKEMISMEQPSQAIVKRTFKVVE